MAKSTKVAKPSKAESKAVKSSSVAKPPKSSKPSKAKDTAKAAAKDVEKKKKKKKVVEPESSESKSESESDSDASDSDSDASEDKAPKKAAANGKKAATNGKKAATKKDVKAEESSDSDSDADSDSDESEEEKVAPKSNGAAADGSKAAESSDDSDSDSDSDDEPEEKAAPKASGAKKANSDSEGSEDDSDDSNDSSSDEEREVTKITASSKKRKAEEAIDEASKKAKADDGAATTLFAGSLSWGVDDNALHEAFKSFDGLVSARVVIDKNTGRSRGFGYVDFADSASATKAYEAMQGQEIDGRVLNLDYANSKPAEGNTQNRNADRAKRHGDSLSAESDTLFVGNLPFEADQDSVRDFFGDVAEVASVRLPTDPDSGNLKGFGYVTFNSVEDAKTALEAKNGGSIGNGRMSRAVRLDFAGSRPPRDNNGFGGRGGRGRGGRGDRGGFRGGGRGGFGGRGGGRGGFNSPRGGGFSGTKISFD